MPLKSALFNWTWWCQVFILLALSQVSFSAQSRATCEDGTTRQFFDHFVNVADLSPQPQTGNYRVIPNYFVHQTHSQPEVKRADPHPIMPDKHAASVANPHSTPLVQLLPYHLSFHERPICLASIEYIEVLNLSDKDELHIFSVASESAHFHASFKHTVLPPRANLSIPVVFLAKVLGPAETSLVIQTNLGGFIYQVSGVGVPNQYAVEPLVGVKVLVQHWYSAPIALYNPTSESLTVKEVFTSGGFLHLSLPGSATTGTGTGAGAADNRGLWELTPYQRKQIINLDFQAANAGKYQGFIYIKTDRDMLIVHVEVTVVKSALQLTLDELDFGTLTALTAHRHSATSEGTPLTAPTTRTITLTLLNGHAHAVHVHEVALSALQNDPNIAANIDLKIDFHGPTDLSPLTSRDIGTVTFAAKVDGVYRGKLAIKTNDTNQARIELPFKARVVGGHVIPELMSTTFPISVKGPPFTAVVQPIQLTNKLATPFTVLTAELTDPLFRITHLTPVSSVPVNSTWSGVTVSFTANSTQSHRSELILRTNITTLHVPLTSYSGRLHCAVTGATQPRLLSYGVVSVGQSATKTLTLHNPNPVSVSVLQLNSDLTGLAVTLDHVTDAHGVTQHLSRALSSGPRVKGEQKEPLFTIERNGTAQLSVTLSPQQEELREGRMHLRTSHETLRLNISYHALHGSLRIEPHTLSFDEPAFPGLRLHHSIMAHNSFARAINISHMHTNDPRFIPVVEKKVVEPNVMTKIGYLTFDPALAPHHYMLHTSTAASGALTSEEIAARESLDAMWQHVMDEHSEQIMTQLSVHTDVAVTPVLDVHASLTRPSILHSTTLEYGLTQLHTQRTQYIVLHNPSDHPVHVQLLPLDAELSWWRRVLGWLWQQDREAEFYYPAECTTTALLAPHRQVKLGPLVYVPHHLGTDEVTLTVRNNLTVYERIKVIGQGGSGHLTLHQSPAHTAAAVVLHLDTKHLARCVRGSASGINVTHSFQIVNDGTLPLKVDALGIDTNTCETEDFKLHSCKPFSLSPTQTHNLTVTFTPDFSAATVRRDLVLFTDHGTYSFPLVAHMPPAEVQLCAEVQAPHSAQVAHTARTLFIAFCFCMFVFFVVIIVQEYRYQPQGPRYSDKSSAPEDIEQDTHKRPTPVTSPTVPVHLAHPTPTPTTPKSPSKNTHNRRETLPEPALTLPSMTLESSHVTPASTPLTTTSASPKKAAVTLTTNSAANTNTTNTANKMRVRSNSKGQRSKVDPQAPFTITTAVPVTPTTEHKPKPKSRAHTVPDTASVDVTPVTAPITHLTSLTAVTPAVTPSVIPATTSTTLTPVTVPAIPHIPEVKVAHNTSLTPVTVPVTPAVTPVTPSVTVPTPPAPTVTPVTTTLTALSTDKPARTTEERPPRTKNTKPPSNNVPPYHRGPKRSPKNWVRKDEKQSAELKQSAAESPSSAVEPAVKSEEHTADTADRSNNSTTIAKKEYVKNLYKPAPRVTGVKTPSPTHSPDTNSTRTEGKSVRKSPLPVSPILTTPAPLTGYNTPSLESAASEFSYLEQYYPELEGTELVYNSIAALTGTTGTNNTSTATFNTNLTRDAFSFAAPLEPRLQSRVPPPHGTIGSVKPRAFDPWDRPILFDLDGDSTAHVPPSNSPPSQPSPQSPPRDPWSSDTSPSLFTALPPLFAAPSQHSFFSSPTFPRVSKSSDDVIAPPRADPTVNPLSTSVSSLTAYNPFNGGSLFAMSESPFTPFAPYPHTSSFGSFNLQNLSQLRNSDDTLPATEDE